MENKVIGILIVKNDAIQVTEKFVKREFVIQTTDEYPQTILLQLIQDKTTLLDAFNLGDEIEAFINIRGREWTNPQGEIKYFNSLEAWRINKLAGDDTPPRKPEDLATKTENAEDDDLPF